jgi:hypothetical protein
MPAVEFMYTTELGRDIGKAGIDLLKSKDPKEFDKALLVAREWVDQTIATSDALHLGSVDARAEDRALNFTRFFHSKIIDKKMALIPCRVDALEYKERVDHALVIVEGVRRGKVGENSERFRKRYEQSPDVTSPPEIKIAPYMTGGIRRVCTAPDASKYFKEPFLWWDWHMSLPPGTFEVWRKKWLQSQATDGELK